MKSTKMFSLSSLTCYRFFCLILDAIPGKIKVLNYYNCIYSSVYFWAIPILNAYKSI